jgi:2-polyprenyl-6-methoxyphenol hydroxylase-like FAD-dependent oxidoreductase
MLAKAGIQVTLVEMNKELDKNPRATHYNAPAMQELNRAGVGDEIRSRGFKPRGVCWRKLNGTILAQIDSTLVPDDPLAMTCLPLDQLVELLKEHLLQQKTATMLFDHKVVGLGQDANQAWIFVETSEGLKKLSADYIVGCDGANSQIRRILFGNWEFPGHTWDKQIVATNVRISPASPNLSSSYSLHRHRPATTSISLAGRIPTSSSTGSIGSWPQRLPTTAYGE